MRRIRRRDLPRRVDGYLRRKQAELDAAGNGSRVERLWRNARKTKAFRGLLGVLHHMARSRLRCMFCEDSRGTDIEHFWPKGRYPQRAFDWENLLLICSGCNRAKGDRFPLDAGKEPLLIDPTAEDPWDHLFFDPVTGNLAPRYGPDGIPRTKATHTLDILPLCDEAITEGRRRSYRRLVGAVRAFLSQYSRGLDAAANSRLVLELRQAVQDSDDYGLGQWAFSRDGACSDPFSALRASYPTIWAELRDLVTA